ncbi:MAG: hypothetical protein LUD15_12355 [Bacteroides sp.]|nr:hypothetical protein [Bacteroides sp.]MCD8262751.1 hypothetical protein [Tannerellaceae bacterium]
MRIIYTKTVTLYLRGLVKTLYQKDYFGFHESARKYVISLIRNMETTIHLKQKHYAPVRYARYGKDLYYVVYPKNKRTTWYFFFTYHPEDDLYFIRYITNNHVTGHLLV